MKVEFDVKGPRGGDVEPIEMDTAAVQMLLWRFEWRWRRGRHGNGFCTFFIRDS